MFFWTVWAVERDRIPEITNHIVPVVISPDVVLEAVVGVAVVIRVVAAVVVEPKVFIMMVEMAAVVDVSDFFFRLNGDMPRCNILFTGDSAMKLLKCLQHYLVPSPQL